MQPQLDIKYVAELDRVREISLLGTADLEYWRNALQDEDVTLGEVDGRAQVLIIAAAAEYMGLGFHEVSVSLILDGFHGETVPGAYLLQAFNSRRFFVFCERVLFRTPYAHAEVDLNCWPALIEVSQRGTPIFRADNSADHALQEREPEWIGEDGWNGPVLLPGGSRRDEKDGRLFFAKISGETRVYPFLPSDGLVLKPAQGCDVGQQLIDSGFTGKHWVVREDASHAKSKTYSRTKAMDWLVAQ